MKLVLPFKSKKNFVALFSNIGCDNPKQFYLLATYHKSRKGGFGTNITVEECEQLLKEKGYEYISYEKVIYKDKGEEK